MAKTDKEIKKIMQEAEKILRAETKNTPTTNIHISPEAKRLYKKYAEFRKLSGRRRLTNEEKEALLKYTPKQVLKQQTLSTKAFQKRLAAYEALTGTKAGFEDFASLRYLTAKQLIKKKGIEAEEPDKEPEKSETPTDPFPDTFTPAILPTISWWSLPQMVRQSSSMRKRGSILYENTELFFSGAERIDLNHFLLTGIDGNDYSVVEFIRLFCSTLIGDLFVDPMGEDTRFVVKSSEWDDVEALSPDYVISRRYKKKDE